MDATQEKIKSLHIHVLSIYVLRPLLFPLFYPFLRFFLHMEVYGLEKLEAVKGKKTIFAINHNSEVDPIVFQFSLPFFSRFIPLYFVSLSKKYYPFRDYGIRSLIYGGLLFRLMGAYPIYKRMHDFEKALYHHLQILSKGYSVCIFPEGKKSLDGTIGKAKPGYIYLASKTKTPIFPVRIEGTFRLSFKDFLSRKRRVKVFFGDVVMPDKLPDVQGSTSRKELEEKAEEVMAILKQDA